MYLGGIILKKGISIGIILLFIVSAVSPMVIGFDIEITERVETILNEDGNTLYVGGSGPNNYTKVQDAIDDASDGDTVFVYSGHYYERLLINKSLFLQGEYCNTTFLNSYFFSTVIHVISPDVTIEGFTIQNSSTHHTNFYAGIKGLADNLHLSDLNLVNNGIGVFLQDSQGHYITSCRFINNGLYVDNSTDNIVLNCMVNQMPLIYVEDELNQHVISAGQVIVNQCTNISVDSVYLRNVSVGMQILNSYNISLENSYVENNSFGGILVKDSSLVFIKQNFFGDNWYTGVEFCSVQRAACCNNTFTKGSNVHLIDSFETTILNNAMTDCGVRLKNSSYCLVGNNSFKEQSWGIVLYFQCQYNIISGNVMDNISGGIAIEEQSANNLIDRNCLIGGYTGIRFYRFSTLNTVSENLVRDTYRGITVEFGCDYNQFMDNSIENNTVQGMSIESAEQQYICNNSFTNNGMVLEGISYHYVKDNIVNGKPLVYLQNQSDMEILDAGQVILVGCSNIHILNLTMSNTTIGIQLIDSFNTLINGNILSDNNRGVALSNSEDNIILKNLFIENNQAIDLDSSHANSIQNNTIIAGGNGIALDSSHRNLIKQNTIKDNIYYGVYISYSNANIISMNIILRNRIGVYLNDYLEWLTSFLITSKWNLIEGNNLYENHEHDGYFENAILNRWNHNYWNNSQMITVISGEIYAERGWHFGSPPPISIRCLRIDWHSAQEPYDI